MTFAQTFRKSHTDRVFRWLWASIVPIQGALLIAVGVFIFRSAAETHAVHLGVLTGYNFAVMSGEGIFIVVCGSIYTVVGLCGIILTSDFGKPSKKDEEAAVSFPFMCCCCFNYFYGVGIILAIFPLANLLGDVNGEMEFRTKLQLRAHYVGIPQQQNYFSVALDGTQVQFQCCGMEDFHDFEEAEKWHRSTPDNSTSLAVPVTCCKLSNEREFHYLPSAAKPYDTNCTVAPNEDNSYYTQGCWKKVKAYMVSRLTTCIALVAAYTFCSLLLPFLVLGCYCSVEQLRQRWYQKVPS